MMMVDLNDVNELQQEAIYATEGPVLILAGAGSGKTRVITYRITHLIQQGVSPYSILAITFTNKAAGEMARRVARLTGHQGLWICTFHSFCVRILRREIHVLGFSPHFSIQDAADQEKIIKEITKTLNLDSSRYKPSKVAAVISKAKNNLLGPDDIQERGYWFRDVARIFRAYQEQLRRNDALDFDDLLQQTLILFDNYKDVLSRYQDKFRYILIDEFQDTNLPQYRIARALAARDGNICVCGDPDQSIYTWRGADITHIINFERDFPNTKVIRLEQNYRSTPAILKVASTLIAHNKIRREKRLWTTRPDGPAVAILEFLNDKDEAQALAYQIQDLQHQQGLDLADMAIFYRINSQSRILETALHKIGLPYTIVAGTEFYQRAEIKDIIAYLKLLANPRDDSALRRIINTPPRGIGLKKMEWLNTKAQEYGLPLYQTLEKLSSQAELKGNKQKFQHFLALLQELRQLPTRPVYPLMRQVMKLTGYREYLRHKDERQDEDRVANLEELLSSAQEFDQSHSQGDLVDFLSHISLLTALDSYSPGKGRINLMTLHAAKGLEFPAVFISGVVEGLLPHKRSLENEQQLEEERRLLFVGITRAQKYLTLSAYRYSQRGAQQIVNMPSRFIREIQSAGSCIQYQPLSHNLEIATTQMVEETGAYNSELDIGQRVEHPMLGSGTIIGLSGFGVRRVAVVEFDLCGPRELLLQYTELKKI